MKARFVFTLIAAVILAVPSIAEERSGPIGKMTVNAAGVDWVATGSYESLSLVVGMPDGTTITRTFNGNHASLRPSDVGGAEGTYTFELRAVPRITGAVKGRLAAARAKNDEAAIAQIKAEAGISEAVVQAGAFAIHNGAFIDGSEAPYAGAKGPGKGTANAVASPGKLNPTPNDVVTADDAIIQGSLCVGLDCVNNESFGFDTIRLKENNTRIKFDDTSTTAGCPNNDWQLTANDACGGANKFSIEDITGSKVPFTITAGAPTNSVFVASSGKVGFGNNSPGLNLHITATDTPAIRQEQTNGGGFTAQTWDIGANEANWFVRDLTGGSRLPFRIRPGAPTSSIDISAAGNVGIGTASAAYPLDVFSSSINTPLRVNGTSNPGVVLANNGAVEFSMAIPTAASNFITGSSINDVTFRADGGGKILFSTSTIGSTNGLTISGTNVGIGTFNPTAQLSIVSGTSSSTINAGSTQFTAVSSRTFKENIQPVKTANILEKIEAIPVVTYDFKNNGPKDRMGLIAEDFYKVFGRGDDKHIDGQDVQMALWLAVQQLTAQNKELTDRLTSLEKELQQKQQ